ncbi:MAG TPA: 50S ribosomal protein L3 N(5)-glutamine methyltransferase [Woeseiaceae bacterium]|nr:50S ribosomal protein L3 N(5)-glutamine methyltransferase [Woeseiaceae bacterium]|tara:strand:+ start:14075 stop:14971 length:897 start_codon:yes stop_codon:yes gene_type:complete
MLTVEALIQKTADRFNYAKVTFAHGTENATDEAAYLIFGYLKLDHADAQNAYQRLINEGELDVLEKMIKQRIEENYPIAYILNQAWFAGMDFFVDERVLIPRSPISELINKQLRPWIDTGNLERALDLGTGSGCIAIALANAFPGLSVDAIDCSEEALEVASINVERYNMSARVKLIKSDFFAAFSSKRSSHQYDLILSNPPYVDSNEIKIMAPEFHHEPIIGLASGEDGLESVSSILNDAGKYLRNHGVLIVEVGNSQWALEEKYPNLPFVWLELEMGGTGVFLLTKEDLDNHNNGY